MKYLPALIVVAIFAFAVSAEAATMEIDGSLGGIMDCVDKSYCWDGNDPIDVDPAFYVNSNFDADGIADITGTSGLIEIFKDDDPYVGGLTFNVGTDADYLYIKEGSNEPKWYVYDLGYMTNWPANANWDGTVTLVGEWFGKPYEDGEGPISHVAAYGVSAVPVPPAVWLFGSGLIGLVGVARRKA